MSEPERIVLPRTGQRDLAFIGMLEAEVTTQGDNDAWANYSGDRGHSARVRIYAGPGGRYFAAVASYSSWSGAPPQVDSVEQFRTLDDCIIWIEDGAPLPLWARDALLEALDAPPETVA